MIIYADLEKMENIKKEIKEVAPNAQMGIALVVQDLSISRQEEIIIAVTAMGAGASIVTPRQ